MHDAVAVALEGGAVARFGFGMDASAGVAAAQGIRREAVAFLLFQVAAVALHEAVLWLGLYCSMRITRAAARPLKSWTTSHVAYPRASVTRL